MTSPLRNYTLACEALVIDSTAPCIFQVHTNERKRGVSDSSAGCVHTRERQWKLSVLARVCQSHSHKRTAEYSVSYRVSFHSRELNGYSVTIVFCLTFANAMATVSLFYFASHSRTQWLQCHYCILRHTRERNGKSSLTALFSHLTKAMEIVLQCFHIMETYCSRPSFTRDYTGHRRSSVSLFSPLSPSAQ